MTDFEARITHARDELELLCENAMRAYEAHLEFKARAEKTEAELARWRPLIEAAEKLDQGWIDAFIAQAAKTAEKREEGEMKKETTAHQDHTTFKSRTSSLLAIRAAKAFIKAQAELADRGLEVADWEMIGGKVTAMEFRDTETGDKAWAVLDDEHDII